MFSFSKPKYFFFLLASFFLMSYFLCLVFLPTYALINLYLQFLIVGTPLVISILQKLMKGDFGADLLAALSTIIAIYLHEYLAASVIVLMLASGDFLENHACAKASSVLNALIKRMPSIAHVQINHQIQDIPLDAIKIKDIVLVYPHEACPVDGTIINGYSHMDESYLTGEPYKIAKAPGSKVISGAINGNNLLYVESSKLAKDSRYEAIIKVLKEAEETRPEFRKLADKIAKVFTPVSLIIALICYIAFHDSIRMLAVLVCATPCPLLIALPITLISAISQAAKQAIIIKNPRILEELPNCKTAIFDKTGTLTIGKPRLKTIETFHEFHQNMVLQYAASLERFSKHPLAEAILHASNDLHLPPLDVHDISEKPGEGLLGTVENISVRLCGRKQLDTKEIPQSKSIAGLECIILINNILAGIFHFHDAPRPECANFIAHLKPAHHFEKIMLVSGDRASEVNYLANLLHIKDIYAGQSPEDKLDIVKKESAKAKTVFMGDGINDAPALKAATIGIAFGEFNQVSAEAADAVIMENSFYKVDTLFHLSIKTRKIALQSGLGGMLLSLVAMAFAAFGHINPLQGAIIQEVIDVLAILNALRLSFGKEIPIDTR